MAFRKLSEDDIALLDESERIQYEKQLKIYHERTAFVEKLEQIENANIQYTKPKLKRIKPVPKLEIPKYKSIGIVKIKLPETEANKSLFLQLENQSVSTVKIKKRMAESSAVCVRINPITKVAVPLLKPYCNMPKRVVSLSKPKVIIPSVSYPGKTKYFINGISDYAKAITVPQCRFAGMLQRKITGIPKKNVPMILPVDFKYERKFTDIFQISTPLPKSVKYNFDSSIKIKDMPFIFTAEISNKVFHAPKCGVKDIPNINVSIPEIKFEKPKHKIQNMPQLQISAVNCDFSAIHQKVSSALFGKVHSFNKHMPSVPSIKPYTKPECKAALPNLETISIPSVNQYTPPSSRNVIAVTPHKIKEMCILAKPIGKVTIEKDKIPLVNMHTPNYSEIDVKNILNITHKELQGV